MYGAYVGNGRVLTNTQYGARLFYPAEDIHVMPLVATRGYHEPCLTNWLAKGQFKGARMVDVGAQVGYFTVLMARVVGPTGYVAAFEPMPRTLEFLRLNLSCNYVTKLQGHTVEVFEQAVGDKVEEREIYWTTGEESGASLHGYYGTLEHEEKHVQKVSCTTLDAVLEGNFDIIKIDTEGSEYRVLKGATETLKRTKNVIFEWNPDVLGKDFKPLYKLLHQYADKGATFHYLSMDGTIGHRKLSDLENIPFEAHVLMHLGSAKL